VKLTTHLRLEPRLRMGGDISLLPLIRSMRGQEKILSIIVTDSVYRAAVPHCTLHTTPCPDPNMLLYHIVIKTVHRVMTCTSLHTITPVSGSKQIPSQYSTRNIVVTTVWLTIRPFRDMTLYPSATGSRRYEINYCFNLQGHV